MLETYFWMKVNIVGACDIASATITLPSDASIISIATDAAVHVPSLNTFFLSTNNESANAKVFTIELANLIKINGGCLDIELVSITN